MFGLVCSVFRLVVVISLCLSTTVEGWVPPPPLLPQGAFSKSTTTTTTTLKTRRTLTNHHRHHVTAAAATLTPLEPDVYNPTAVTTTFQIPSFWTEEDEDDEETAEYPTTLHYIHVQPLLSESQAAKALKLAQQFAASTGRWDQPDAARHATYATCDFPVDEAPDLAAYLEQVGFHSSVWESLEQMFGIEQEELTYLDFFCANYRAKNNNNNNVQTMDRLEGHRDGSLLSFTVTLSPPESFAGGGTFFEALKDVDDDSELLRPGGVVRPLRAGHGVLHCGKLFHGADVVTAGDRTVLVGFVDVAEWCQRPGALFEACRDWGRMDVALRRAARQSEKITTTTTNDESHKNNNNNNNNNNHDRGWFLDVAKWLPRATRTSCLTKYSPALESVRQRNDPAFQREQRLIAEDRFLRRILLFPEEKESQLELYGSDDFTVM